MVDTWHWGMENQQIQNVEGQGKFLKTFYSRCFYSSCLLVYSFNDWQIILKLLEFKMNLKQLKCERTCNRPYLGPCVTSRRAPLGTETRSWVPQWQVSKLHWSARALKGSIKWKRALHKSNQAGECLTAHTHTHARDAIWTIVKAVYFSFFLRILKTVPFWTQSWHNS